MLMRTLLASVLLLSLAACSGPPDEGDQQPALLDVWGGLDASSSTVEDGDYSSCDVLFGTWFPDFGVRGLACVAGETSVPTTLVSRAGMSVFESGPHVVTSEQFNLDLSNERSFGHYSEEFVEWFVENGVVGKDRPAVRRLTQPIYDNHMMRLARLYWLTYEDMAADNFPDVVPAGPLSDYANFLEGGPIPQGAESYEGGYSVYAFTSLSEGLLPRAELQLGNEWEAKYEANTAFGFWIRRRADGTLDTWVDGLSDLLSTYDNTWFSARQM